MTMHSPGRAANLVNAAVNAAVDAAVDAAASMVPGATTAPQTPADDAHATSGPIRLTKADRKLRIINLAAVLIPCGGFLAAALLAWGEAFNWTQAGIFLGMTLVTSFGVTVGFHRLCTHKSFKTPAVMRYLFAAAGSMAVQGPVIRWCAEHRKHHQYSDGMEDPHSPHMGENGSWGEGFWATLRGFYHAQFGWLLVPRARAGRDLAKYAKDLREDPALVAADKHFLLWVAMGLLIPTALGGILTLSLWGALMGFLWGGLVRIFWVHHVTWSVNSVCHLWGSKPFDSHDESRNNPIVGLLAMGEGWHNNHHAFPASARHGLRWWQFDASYLLIRAMSLVGLAKDINIPPRERIERKKRKKAA